MIHTDTVEEIIKALLYALGENPMREGLKDTPRRVAKFYQEFMEYSPGNTGTTFEPIQVDQMVIVKKIPIYSLCEHHLLPFHCEVSIGYITKDKVLGLSKFARIAQQYAHRLQLQERLAFDIATEVKNLVETDDVAVYAEGEHLCMQMRGIKSPGKMVTSIMWGCFRDEASARQEFLSLIKD
jgi:GTP cyclohydrolase I